MADADGRTRATIVTMAHARTLVAAALAAGLALVGLTGARGVPPRLTDAEFWRMVTDYSEPGGYFPADNFVSNEMVYQTVVPRLREQVAPGGVYLGVGPDQNFTYIVALRPAIAFIVDVRRQNLLQHLMFKALFEMSPTRADFASRLFGRPRPPDLADTVSIEDMMDRFQRSAPSGTLFEETSRRVLDRLSQHGFGLTPVDKETVQFLLARFHEYGPEITYAPVPRGGRIGPRGNLRYSMFPSYGELVAETDEAGVNHGYMASEAHYRILRDMQIRNLIVPIVGDFSGDKALRSVGRYLADRDARVTTVYTSNVEQYLFQNNVWRAYYENIAALPLDETSMFIRAFFPFGARITVNPQALAYDPAGPPGAPINLYKYPESTTLLCSVKALLTAVKADQVAGYLDVIDLSR
jgi:hypothetical protein